MTIRQTRSRRAITGLAAALAVVIAVTSVSPASSVPADPDAGATPADRTTVRLTGTLGITYVERRGTGDEPRGVAETVYSVTDSTGRTFEVVADLGRSPAPGSTFTGELIVPPSVTRSVERGGVAVADGGVLRPTSASGSAVLDALDRSAGPVLATRATVTAPAAAAPAATTTHSVYVAKISNRGAYAVPGVSTDAQIRAKIVDVASYWRREANGQIAPTLAVSAVTSYASTRATTANHCGFAGDFDQVLTEARSKFPGVSFSSGTNHIVVLVPPDCADGYTGLGHLGSGFGSAEDGSLSTVDEYFESTVAHELGHNFGLGHSHGLFCDPDCIDEPYADFFSVMGYANVGEAVPSLSGPQREFENATDPDEFQTVTATSETGLGVTLEPRSARSGVRSAKVTAGDGQVYYLEYRSGAGDDAGTNYASAPTYLAADSSATFAPSVTILQGRDRYTPGDGTVLLARPDDGVYSGGWPVGTTFESDDGSLLVHVDSITPGEEAHVTVTLVSGLLPRLRATAPPAILGDPVIGSTLTVSDVTWTGGPGLGTVGQTYQWFRDDEPIAGATDATYQPGADDLRVSLGVTVFATAEGHRPSPTSAEPVFIDDTATLSPRGAVTISGRPAPGSTLSVDNPAWSDDPEVDPEFTFQWSRDGDPIAGATGARHAVRPSDVGRHLEVEVTASAEGHHPGTAFTDPVLVRKATPTLEVRTSTSNRRVTIKPTLTLPGTAKRAVSSTVRIYVDGALRKTLRLSAGTGSFRTATLSRRTHTITVKYAGSSAYSARTTTLRKKIS